MAFLPTVFAAARCFFARTGAEGVDPGQDRPQVARAGPALPPLLRLLLRVSSFACLLSFSLSFTASKCASFCCGLVFAAHAAVRCLVSARLLRRSFRFCSRYAVLACSPHPHHHGLTQFVVALPAAQVLPSGFPRALDQPVAAGLQPVKQQQPLMTSGRRRRRCCCVVACPSSLRMCCRVSILLVCVR